MKACPKCKNFGCSINQGMWWCKLGLAMDNENCEACDTSFYDNAVITATPPPDEKIWINFNKKEKDSLV